MTQESQKPRTNRIRSNLSKNAQKEFDLGMKVTEEYKKLFEKLAKT